MYFIGGALIFTGVLLFVSDRVRRGRKTEKNARLRDALIVGVGQAIALCPGVSRSGMTITTGCFAGFERKFAVRFSFILSIPAVLGANILSLKDALDAGIDWASVPMYLAGVVVAAVTGYLCIRQLRKYMKDGDRVLDVGCGSGILSIVALKLGAGSVVGTDIDEACLTSTYENFEVNHLARELGTFYCGNLIDDTALQETVGGGYDIVVANILADVIIPMAPVIPARMKEGGIFITSGIIDFKEQEVAAAIEAAGLTILEINHQGEWVNITAQK